MPKYYEYIGLLKTLDFENAVNTMFFDQRMPVLKDEGKAVLVSEFGGEYKIYFSILEAIASGKTTVGEIANIFEGKSGTTSRYLDILRNDHELVRRETPITEDPRKSRLGVYRLNDNFLKFWFAFIKRYESYYEQGRVHELKKDIFPELWGIRNRPWKILDILKKKSKFVPWKVKDRVEYFGIIGKSIEDKEKLREEGYPVFDLRDFKSQWIEY